MANTATIDRRAYSVSEVAAMTGLSKSTVRNLIADGTLRVVQARGKNSRVVVLAASLDAFLGGL